MIRKNLITGKCHLNDAEITQDEYDALIVMYKERAALVHAVYHGEISIDSVRDDWKDEIAERVAALIEAEEEAEAIELTETEQKAAAYDILTGVSE